MQRTYNTRLLKQSEVLYLTAVSRDVLRSKIVRGIFVPPISNGSRYLVWIESEVEALILAWTTDTDEEEIRKLVGNLIKSRCHQIVGGAA